MDPRLQCLHFSLNVLRALLAGLSGTRLLLRKKRAHADSHATHSAPNRQLSKRASLCNELVKELKKKHGKDDVTVIVVQVLLLFCRLNDQFYSVSASRVTQPFEVSAFCTALLSLLHYCYTEGS
eukprot:1543746-Pleurochrysis_carterae.AAC.1